MKNTKRLVWITPLALLLVGCNVPVKQDPSIALWQQNGFLPPTGGNASRIYSSETPTTGNYPYLDQPQIIVEGDQKSVDYALARDIRGMVETDRGLAPSLTDVTIAVENGRVTLRGSVRSDMDARVLVDELRDLGGVTFVRNELQINPNGGI